LAQTRSEKSRGRIRNGSGLQGKAWGQKKTIVKYRQSYDD